MAELTTFDLLALHVLVADLPAARLSRLAVHARPVQYPHGHRLFHAGDQADRLWLVRSGRILLDRAVPGRGGVVVDTRDDLVGWSALVPPYRWELGAVTSGTLHAVEFRAPGLRACLRQNPDLAGDFYPRMLAAVGGNLRSAQQRLIRSITCPPGRLPLR